MNTALRNYLLVIKTGNNSYLPIEWETINDYQKENLYTLEGIDTFTSRFSESELLNEALDQNIVSPDDPYRTLSIIFKENGKNREVKEGIIYRDSYETLTEEEFVAVLLKAVDTNDKETINNVIMQCKNKDNNPELEKFIYILKNINIFKEKGENGIKAALSMFYNLPYDLKRQIRLKVSKKIVFK